MAQPPKIYRPGRLDYVWNSLGTTNKEYGAKISDYIERSVPISYEDLVLAAVGSRLTPGLVYAVTGFNKNMPAMSSSNPCGRLPEILYDDGTNPGITIYMQAITSTKLADSGYGRFYNPAYYGEPEYLNPDPTGLYGIWNTDVTYNIGDIVFWGGYAWINITGNLGYDADVFTLSPDWRKIKYSEKIGTDPVYKVVIDEIKVDWNNGVLIERYNVENNVKVSFNLDYFGVNMLPFVLTTRNPIAYMGFGLYPQFANDCSVNNAYGIFNVECVDSIVEAVNFKGTGFYNLKWNRSWSISANIKGGCEIRNSVFEQTFVESLYMEDSSFFDHLDIYLSTMIGNSLFGYSRIIDLYMRASSFDYSILSGIAEIFNLRIYDSTVYYLELYGSEMRFNTLTNQSYISECLFESESTFNYNTFNDSGIFFVDFNGSYLENNTLTNCSGNFNRGIWFLNFAGGSYIKYCTLANLSLITDTTSFPIPTHTALGIEKCNFFSGGLDLKASGALTSKNLGGLYVDFALIDQNLSTATDIFLNTRKEIFTRADGTVRLLYYNTTDTPIIVNANA